MDRTTAANSVGVLPAYDAGPVGFHSDKVVGVSPGTILSASHLNLITEELRNVIVEAGITPDPTVDDQLKDAIPIVARLAGSSTSSADSDCAVFASTGSQASDTSNGVLASDGANAAGTRSAVIASDAGAGDAQTLGTNCAVIGCESTTADGSRSVVVASNGSSTLAGKTNQLCAASKSGSVTEGESALLATEGCTTAGQYSSCISSLNSTASGSRSSVLASSSCVAAEAVSVVEASTTCEVYAAGSTRKAIIGSLNSVTRAGNNCVLLASEGARVDEGNVIAAGYSAGGAKPGNGAGNQNITFKVDVPTGTVYGDSAYTTPAADYAECFPLSAGGRLEPGILVAGELAGVRVAGPGDRIRGVTSAAPNVVGNVRDPGHRYQLDEWGRPIEIAGVRLQRDGYDGRDGQDRTRAHGWATVSLLGQVRVRVTAEARPGDLLGAVDGGIGAPTKKPSGRCIEVMEIVSPFDVARGYAIALCLVG